MKMLTVKQWRGLFFFIAVLLIVLGIAHRYTTQLHAQEPSPPVQPASDPVKPSSDGQVTKASPAADIVPAPMRMVQAVQAASLPVSPQQTQPQQLGSKVYYRNKVAVLTYHHLALNESSVTISPDRFESHLEALKKNGFRIISMADFVRFLQQNAPVPPNAVVITFDDGYESVYQYAYPLLKRQGMTATVFLIVSYIEDGTVRQPRILTWSEIEAMHRDGFSFYSHSYDSHESVFINGKETSELVVKLTNPGTGKQETDSEYRARISSDLRKADDILHAKLGNAINLLCLPHGQYNQEVVRQANQAGIPFLFTGTDGINSSKDQLIKRINAGSPYVSDKWLIRKLADEGRG
jgi:biofilm PGA synthesis lipoprotein PgaB